MIDSGVLNKGKESRRLMWSESLERERGLGKDLLINPRRNPRLSNLVSSPYLKITYKNKIKTMPFVFSKCNF